MCLFTQMWMFVILCLFDMIIILRLLNHSISVKYCLQVHPQTQTHPHPRQVQTPSVSQQTDNLLSRPINKNFYVRNDMTSQKTETDNTACPIMEALDPADNLRKLKSCSAPTAFICFLGLVFYPFWGRGGLYCAVSECIQFSLQSRCTGP